MQHSSSFSVFRYFYKTLKSGEIFSLPFGLGLPAQCGEKLPLGSVRQCARLTEQVPVAHNNERKRKAYLYRETNPQGRPSSARVCHGSGTNWPVHGNVPRRGQKSSSQRESTNLKEWKSKLELLLL